MAKLRNGSMALGYAVTLMVAVAALGFSPSRAQAQALSGCVLCTGCTCTNGVCTCTECHVVTCPKK